MDSSTKQKLALSAATTLGLYVILFGFPFQGTISNYVHNRLVLKQQKMRYAHEEEMAKIKKENEEN